MLGSLEVVLRLDQIRCALGHRVYNGLDVAAWYGWLQEFGQNLCGRYMSTKRTKIDASTIRSPVAPFRRSCESTTPSLESALPVCSHPLESLQSSTTAMSDKVSVTIHWFRCTSKSTRAPHGTSSYATMTFSTLTWVNGCLAIPAFSLTRLATLKASSVCPLMILSCATSMTPLQAPTLLTWRPSMSYAFHHQSNNFMILTFPIRTRLLPSARLHLLPRATISLS